MELVVVVHESCELAVRPGHITVVMKYCSDVPFRVHAKLFKTNDVTGGLEVSLIERKIIVHAKIVKRTEKIVVAVRMRGPVHGEVAVRRAGRRTRRLGTIDIGIHIHGVRILGFIIDPYLDVHGRRLTRFGDIQYRVGCRQRLGIAGTGRSGIG